MVLVSFLLRVSGDFGLHSKDLLEFFVNKSGFLLILEPKKSFRLKFWLESRGVGPWAGKIADTFYWQTSGDLQFFRSC